MSKEEIIHCIELCIENNGIPSEGINWVKGLLDLYQKEKEKNKEYEKLHLTEYKLAPDGNLLSKTIELDDYISKDKIRAKINKLKKNDIEYSEYIAMLEELLQEGERK